MKNTKSAHLQSCVEPEVAKMAEELLQEYCVSSMSELIRMLIIKAHRAIETVPKELQVPVSKLQP